MRGDVMSEPYIYHHGIQGQKWGQRRYQNPDGTLTAAGKERYQREAYRELKKSAKYIAFNDRSGLKKANSNKKKLSEKVKSSYTNNTTEAERRAIQKKRDDYTKADFKLNSFYEWDPTWTKGFENWDEKGTPGRKRYDNVRIKVEKEFTDARNKYMDAIKDVGSRVANDVLGKHAGETVRKNNMYVSKTAQGIVKDLLTESIDTYQYYSDPYKAEQENIREFEKG